MAELEAHFDHYVLFVAASQTDFSTAPAKIIKTSSLRLPWRLNDQCLFLALLCSKHVSFVVDLILCKEVPNECLFLPPI